MIKVYQYGLLAPIQEAQEVRTQILEAHRYRNQLVEIERARRAAVREAYAPISELEAAAKAADARVVEAYQAIKDARKVARKRAEGEDLKAALVVAKDFAKAAKTTLFAARKELREGGALAPRMAEINELAGALARGARAICGAYWGTYCLIEQEMDAVKKMPLYDGIEPNDPRFQRWTGEGQLGCALHQKGLGGTGLTVDEAHTGISGEWFRIERAADPRQGRRAGTRCVLHMRIGTRDGKPVVAKWPMTMHRPLTAGTIVRRATVSCRKVGRFEKWTVEITVQTASVEPSCGTGYVAINVGWRKVPSGLRVAYWHGSDGQHGELLLSDYQIGGFRKSRDLRSIRDRHFDEVRAALHTWLRTVNVPEWMQLRTKAIEKWKSQDRLRTLLAHWLQNRIDGDTAIIETLRAWMRKDIHLWDWEVNQGRSSHLNRRETYRLFGVRLARQYDVVVFGDFDKRQVARRKDQAENETARSQRQLASTSELEREVAAAFTSRGGRVEYIDTHDVTHICRSCGTVDVYDAAAGIQHTCSGCKLTWDQDANAAEVLCERFRLVQETRPASTVKSEEQTGGRFQKAKNKKKERLASRNPDANDA